MAVDDVADSRARFIASIERLTRLLVDRLDESPSGKEMDEKETRMLGSIVMKSFKIWEKALNSRPQEQKALERLVQAKRALETAEKES